MRARANDVDACGASTDAARAHANDDMGDEARRGVTLGYIWLQRLRLLALKQKIACALVAFGV